MCGGGKYTSKKILLAGSSGAKYKNNMRASRQIPAPHTPKQEIEMNRSDKFFKELKELCKKYKVAICAQDDGRLYGMHSARILFDFDYMEEDYGAFEDQVIETRIDGD